MPRTIHVIGAGLAGLAAAIRLAEAGEGVIVHEAAGQAGGRCRSYHDPALDMMIDNGNHLVLSGNHATLAYLRTIGAQDRLIGPAQADFPFVDLATNERWTLKLGEGRVPWWVFDSKRRVPGTRLREYFACVPLLWASRERSVCDAIKCAGPLYERLVRPLLLAALNTEPREGSAALAAAVLRETIAAGGRACRPLIARHGLGHAFVDPALAYLRARGVPIRFGHRLREFGFARGRIESLRFGDDDVRLPADDAVILAVPPVVAAALVPALQAPSAFRAIVNAHFRATPANAAPIVGVINGTAEWIFAFRDRLSVTISGADRLLEVPRETLATTLWREVAAVTGIGDTQALPPWQVVRERRATFAALPGEDRRRPGPPTAWDNLWLAGDWTATGLPATIEGAIRSGERAAKFVRAPKSYVG